MFYELIVTECTSCKKKFQYVFGVSSMLAEVCVDCCRKGKTKEARAEWNEWYSEIDALVASGLAPLEY